MKVEELIEDLQSYNGDLEIRLDLDHCSTPNVFWFEVNEDLNELRIIQGNSGL